MFHIKAFKKIRGRGLFGVHFKMFHKLFKRIEGLGYIFILRLNRSLPFYGFYEESCYWRRGHLVVELSGSSSSWPKVHSALLIFSERFNINLQREWWWQGSELSQWWVLLRWNITLWRLKICSNCAGLGIPTDQQLDQICTVTLHTALAHWVLLPLWCCDNNIQLDLWKSVCFN